MMWVRFPSPAPFNELAHVAQAVEHFLGKEEVTGSTPVMSSILRMVHEANHCRQIQIKNRKTPSLNVVFLQAISYKKAR